LTEQGLVAVTKVNGGYRIWVYGLLPEEARKVFKISFSSIGDLPLCYSSDIFSSIPEPVKAKNPVPLTALLETFISNHFPPYQRKVIKILPFLPKVLRQVQGRLNQLNVQNKRRKGGRRK